MVCWHLIGGGTLYELHRICRLQPTWLWQCEECKQSNGFKGRVECLSSRTRDGAERDASWIRNGLITVSGVWLAN